MTEVEAARDAIFQDIQQESTPRSKELGRDEFLNLLTIQLRTQNPLNPTDNTEFVAQLAQFSQLEQLADIRSAVEAQVDANLLLTQSINNTSATGLIGKTVKSNSNLLTVGSDTDKLTLGYDLFADASSVKVTIRDSNGSLVRTIDATTGKKQGENQISWDGRDFSGGRVRNGEYSFTVEAFGTGGIQLEATPFTSGQVDSVRFRQNGTIVVINDTEHALGSITDVMK